MYSITLLCSYNFSLQTFIYIQIESTHPLKLHRKVNKQVIISFVVFSTKLSTQADESNIIENYSSLKELQGKNIF